MSFAHYYQTELAYFRALLQEYAKTHPEIAHIVSERNSDPAVERLVQGASLLTARARFRIDDRLPEIIQGLFQRMWPQYLRPIPAISMVQFSVGDGAQNRAKKIPKGFNLSAKIRHENKEHEIRFITTEDVDALPLSVERAFFDQEHPSDLQLILRMKIESEKWSREEAIEKLRIQFYGPEKYRIYRLLHRTYALSIRDRQNRSLEEIDGASINAAGFDDTCSLFPFEETPSSGLRAVWEYFIYPDKYLALDISNIKLEEEMDGYLDFVFHLGKRDEDLPRIDPSYFLLGCVPIINILPSERITIPLAEGATKVPIKPTADGEIFSIDRVGCYLRGTQNWIEFSPYFSPGHLGLLDKSPCYQLIRFTDGVEKEELELRISDAEGLEIDIDSDSLEVVLNQTQGHRASRVSPKSLNIAQTEQHGMVDISHPYPVLPPDHNRVDQERCWELLAEFAVHPDDLGSEKGLQNILNHLTIQRSANAPRILKVEQKHAVILHQGGVVNTRQISVDVDEKTLEPDELALFAEVLNRLFKRSFDSHVFNQLSVRGLPSTDVIRFEPH